MITSSKNSNYLFFVFTTVFMLFAGLAVFTGVYYYALIPFVILFFYAGWQWINGLFLLLLFSLPISMEYQVTESLGTDIPDELLMIFVAGLFFCYWVYKPAVLTKPARGHPLIILLLVSFCWAIISTLFSGQPVLSVKYLLAKSWYIGAFILAPLIVFNNKQLIGKAMIAVASSMVLITGITLIRHYFYGYSFAAINDALHPFFRNHVNYSAMLVCVIPIVWAFWTEEKTGKRKNLIALVLAILLVALFLSYARGAWLALFMGAAAAWLIRRRKLILAYIIAMIIMLAAFFWIKTDDRYLQYAHDFRTTIWHSDFRDHLTATYQFKDVSTAERFYRWIAGIRMIKDNWLTGFGPNSFYDSYKPYTIPAFKTWVSNNPEHSTVHNYFLLITIEQGLPGLILFLLLTGAMLYYAQHLYHRIKDVFYKKIALTTGIITMMILTVNFLSDLMETDKVGSLFLLCLSMLVVADVNTRDRITQGE